jgi:hypothetical protein
LYQSSQGFAYNLGDDTGLKHTFEDTEVENGRRYYYAIVAYDRGDEVAGIFPGENTKQVRVLSTGEVENDINVAVVTPNARAAGYVSPTSTKQMDHPEGPATGSASYGVVDETALTGHRYRMTFLDTQTDSVDNNKNHLIDLADSTEWERQTSFYTIQDLEEFTEPFESQDTISVSISRQNLVPGTVTVRDASGAVVAPDRYILNTERGSIRSSTPGSLPPGQYRMSYQYYPVYRSPNLQGTPFLSENTESDFFDGLQSVFENDWVVADTGITWVGKNAYVVNVGPVNLPLLDPPLKGYRRPSDYEIQFSSTIVDTSALGPFPFDVPIPVYFRVLNVTDGTYVKFYFTEGPSPGGTGKISPLDELIVMEKNPRNELFPSWDFFFIAKQGEPADTVYNLTSGDKLIIPMTKPFRQGDVFEFRTEVPTVETSVAGSRLDQIRVVPNPYVTAAEFEPPLNPGITSGRGERKIDFTNLPAGASIKIFTSRGDHVTTLYHDGNIDNGSVSWNLKSKENLDIAFGIYFYVVESPVGNKTGKIAIIK